LWCCSGYVVVYLPFLAFYFCSSYFLYLEYYKDLEERSNIDFVLKFYEFHETSRLMDSWWKEDKKFTNRSNDWYDTIKLIEPYIYMMALIC